MVAEKLASGKYDTLTVCQNETSTGVRSPIADIAKMVVKEFPDVIFAVDAVSSMGGDKILPSETGCDIIFTSSQKCFALPPGIAIAFVNDRALERAKTVSNRGGYTDMVEIFEFEKKHQTPFTPCIPLFYAFKQTFRPDDCRNFYNTIYKRHLRHGQVYSAMGKQALQNVP